MTYQTNTHSQAIRSDLLLAPMLLLHRIGRFFQNRRASRHLYELPDYLLEDIGLTRADIGDAVRRGLF